MNSQSPTQGGGGGGSALPDREALLVALVLVPQSYPRNRFFELYRTAEARRARRRAGSLRAMLEELSGGAEGVVVSPWGEGFEVRYAMPELAAVRRARLERLELTLVAAVLQRRGVADVVVGPLAEAAGGAAIEALGPVLARLMRGADGEVA